jgi:flagellar biosynthesis protein FliP
MSTCRLAISALLLTTLALCLSPTTGVAQWDEGISVRAPEDAFGAPATVPPTTVPPTALAQSDFVPDFAAPAPAEPIAQQAVSEPGVVAEAASFGAEPSHIGQAGSLPHGALKPSQLLSPEELTPTLRTVMLVGMLSLVPALLVMTTCFARFAIVFGLLRQGLGAQQWLPNQIVLALSLLLTLLVMAPVWTRSYEQGLRPYVEGRYETPADQRAALETAITDGVAPVREFMSTQIAATGNEAALDMLLSYQQQTTGEDSRPPQYYEDVPLSVLLPAYLLSELKTAFVIGFQIVLPFLIIDLVVASVLTGMGLMMLPPVLVSLPFKLLLFVLIDGWSLTVEMVLSSVPAV